MNKFDIVSAYKTRSGSWVVAIKETYTDYHGRQRNTTFEVPDPSEMPELAKKLENYLAERERGLK